jgi:hypothetical protein
MDTLTKNNQAFIKNMLDLSSHQIHKVDVGKFVAKLSEAKVLNTYLMNCCYLCRQKELSHLEVKTNKFIKKT